MLKLSEKDDEAEANAREQRMIRDEQLAELANVREQSMIRHQQLSELRNDNTWAIGILSEALSKLNDSLVSLGGNSVGGICS